MGFLVYIPVVLALRALSEALFGSASRHPSTPESSHRSSRAPQEAS